METARDGAIRITARLRPGPAFGRDALPAQHPPGRRRLVRGKQCQLLRLGTGSGTRSSSGAAQL